MYFQLMEGAGKRKCVIQNALTPFKVTWETCLPECSVDIAALSINPLIKTVTLAFSVIKMNK